MKFPIGKRSLERFVRTVGALALPQLAPVIAAIPSITAKSTSATAAVCDPVTVNCILTHSGSVWLVAAAPLINLIFKEMRMRYPNNKILKMVPL